MRSYWRWVIQCSMTSIIMRSGYFGCKRYMHRDIVKTRYVPVPQAKRLLEWREQTLP